jgi:mono/diheme cytochrome c family protein
VLRDVAVNRAEDGTTGSAHMTRRILRVTVAGLTMIGVASGIAGGQEAGSTRSSPSTEAAAGLRSIWDGVYSEAQAKRGAALYSTHCVGCHLETLEGDGPATPLTGPGFSANWDGISMADMVERTQKSMPSDKPGTLSRQQISDVLAFVLRANKLPAGEAELPRQAELLSRILFLATKP